MGFALPTRAPALSTACMHHQTDTLLLTHSACTVFFTIKGFWTLATVCVQMSIKDRMAFESIMTSRSWHIRILHKLQHPKSAQRLDDTKHAHSSTCVTAVDKKQAKAVTNDAGPTFACM
jgi:hypothetical protein